jgi:hypothetical protein
MYDDRGEIEIKVLVDKILTVEDGPNVASR